MGADLYIPALQKKADIDGLRATFDAAVQKRDQAIDPTVRQSAQTEVEAAYNALFDDEFYFRDPYNGSSILHRLGLSWWTDLKFDDPIDEDAEVNVSPEKCLEFLEKVEASELELPDRKQLEALYVFVDDGENSVEAWHEMWRKEREKLISFLKRAAENGGMLADV